MVSEIFIRMVGIFSSRLITFLTSLYIASLLSEGEWGRISLIMNYFTIFLVFAGNFFPRAITTYTAQNIPNTSNSNSALIIGNRRCRYPKVAMRRCITKALLARTRGPISTSSSVIAARKFRKTAIRLNLPQDAIALIAHSDRSAGNCCPVFCSSPQ